MLQTPCTQYCLSYFKSPRKDFSITLWHYIKRATSAVVQRKINTDSTKLYRKPLQQQLKAIQGSKEHKHMEYFADVFLDIGSYGDGS